MTAKELLDKLKDDKDYQDRIKKKEAEREKKLDY